MYVDYYAELLKSYIKDLQIAGSYGFPLTERSRAVFSATSLFSPRTGVNPWSGQVRELRQEQHFAAPNLRLHSHVLRLATARLPYDATTKHAGDFL